MALFIGKISAFWTIYAFFPLKIAFLSLIRLVTLLISITGQLVVHVAGATNVSKAVGIEIAQLPATFAQRLEVEFKK